MAWTLPDLLSAAEAKWGNGKLVSVDQLNAATESLRLANERIAALESAAASAIDPKPLNDRISALEKDIEAKDATIATQKGEISRLEAEYKSGARQAQEQIQRAGASTPVVTDAPKAGGEKDEADQFIERVNSRVLKGETKASAIASTVREFPTLHIAFVKSGKKLS